MALESKTPVEYALQTTRATILDVVSSFSQDTLPMPSLGLSHQTDRIGTFGGFDVVRLIGRGGMGAVYEAIEPTLDRRVALKILLPNLAAESRGRNRFLHEARALSAVRSDHVVTIYTVGEDAGVPFLTMELLEGMTFEDFLRQEKPDLAETVRIARETALGLAAVHEAGLVHRDVKPENVWIETKTGRVKLLDFGLVWTSRDDNKSITFCGTPLYASPEQARAEALDARSDLFSLGAMMYRAIAGRPPFAAASFSETLAQLQTGEPVSIRLLQPNIPDDLAGLIESLLAKTPHDRLHSAGAVAESCLSIATNLMVASGSERIVTIVDDATAADWNDRLGSVIDSSREQPRPSSPFPLLAILSTISIMMILAGVLGFLFLKPAKPSGITRPNNEPITPISNSNPIMLPEKTGETFLLERETLTGWLTPPGGKNDRWELVDGILTAHAALGDQFLLTEQPFRDYELHLEYCWLKPGGHTTILLRAKATKTGAEGLLLNIGDDEGFPAVHGREIGNLYRTGSISYVHSQVIPANAPIGEWNKLRVVVNRQQIEVEQNGILLCTVDLDQHLDKVGRLPAVARSRGSIGLVAHWGEIAYRNIRVKPITPKE